MQLLKFLHPCLQRRNLALQHLHLLSCSCKLPFGCVIKRINAADDACGFGGSGTHSLLRQRTLRGNLALDLIGACQCVTDECLRG